MKPFVDCLHSRPVKEFVDCLHLRPVKDEDSPIHADSTIHSAMCTSDFEMQHRDLQVALAAPSAASVD
jgi:hypothetical protein